MDGCADGDADTGFGFNEDAGVRGTDGRTDVDGGVGSRDGTSVSDADGLSETAAGEAAGDSAREAASDAGVGDNSEVTSGGDVNGGRLVTFSSL